MHTRIDLHLKSVWWQQPPRIRVMIAQQEVFAGALDQDRVVNFEKDLPPGNHALTVDFHSKTDADTDTVNNQDTAVIIDSIVFNDIKSERFVWQGRYCPEYPEIWYQQQCESGNQPETELRYHTYLGWNGTWSLEFTTPIFTWIHQVENLGWVYE